MSDILATILYSTVFIIIFIVIIYYLYHKHVTFKYWKNNGIPYEEPVMICGNLLKSSLGLISIGEDVRRNYEKLNEHPVHGIYMLTNPILMVNDPELIRLILVKEFHRFRDRGVYHNDKVDPLTSNLFFLPGVKWKRLRSKLTPSFTSGKLKQMYPLLKEIGDELATAVNRSLGTSDVVEVKDLSARYTTDTVASIAFGFNCDSLNVPDSEFRKYGDMTVKKRPNFLIALGMFTPSLLHFFRIRLIPKPVYDFFIKTFSDVVEYRKRENIVRNDFLNLLIQLIEKGQIDENESDKTQSEDGPDDVDRITLMEAYAQAFVFFFAGFETSSSTISYALYELAINPDVQEKLFQEIDGMLKSPGGYSYENCLNGVRYLDMVVNETLRRHPTSPFLNRVCVEDCELPGLHYRIPKGMRILIPASGIMKNPKFFPNPDKFDPERFTNEESESRSSYVFLPFGHGPRSCIGIRLGFIQTKVALISLLSEFKFSPCEKTEIPVKYSARSIIQVPASGIYLKVEKRQKTM